MDSFSLYCLATEVDPAQKLRVLGLIEERLGRQPTRPDIQLYKGALLARFSLEIDDKARADRFLQTGLKLMRGALPLPWCGQVTKMQMLYARGLTLAALPDPPVPYEEARDEIAMLVNHPGFNTLGPHRRKKMLSANEALKRRPSQRGFVPAQRSEPHAI